MSPEKRPTREIIPAFARLLALITKTRSHTLTAVALVLWIWGWCDYRAWGWLPWWLDALFLGVGAGAAVWWWNHLKGASLIVRRIAASVLVLILWQSIVPWLTMARWTDLARFFSLAGLTAVFLIGLAWATWFVEVESQKPIPPSGSRPREWNPFRLVAWYYGKRRAKLHQSLGTFLTYTLVFALTGFLLGQLGGCREIYEMPAGGGEPKKMRQVVQVQKVVNKKFVINPYSSVIFNPPPLDNVKLQLLDVTQHRYAVGYGKDPGAGFAKGTPRGKVRLIRLEYAGGDWDQDMGIGSDLNLLIEYGIRTGQPVFDKTESRKISQLANFPLRQSPPYLYITGQRGLEISDDEIKILREYLLEKHGMLFADNGGSAGWHTQFFELMRRALPTLQPIRVPLDHPVHRMPYEIPFLPYVAPHGGKDAWGWVHEGRLVCYYHPGDIGDAWADGHAGVKREISEYCYQLGVNVIFYAHSEYNKWLESQSSSSP